MRHRQKNLLGDSCIDGGAVSRSKGPMNEVTNEPILSKLEQRLGRVHAGQRLGIERDHEAQIFGQGINFVHIENWYSVIRMTLKHFDVLDS
jgi:hypothetical protein